MRTVAVLFADRRGVYAHLPDVDLWDVTRDARAYRGPFPVVAHPPCTRWCQLAFIIQQRYGHAVGDDDGCFASALSAVRAYGGVLEHPARSYAWAAHGLARPVRDGWRRTLDDPGWVCEVSQAAYGHRARKLTWLYCVSRWPRLPDWHRPAPSAQVSRCANHGDSPLPRLSPREASATPRAFRDFLLQLALEARA
jgi:hypothetical protein